MSSRVIICLGSNIEPRISYLDRAQEALSALPGTRLVAVAGTDETVPVDVPPEYSERMFLNRLLVFDSDLSPKDFSDRMHRIEDELGRVRGEVRNAPRTLDIDMIDYEGVKMDDPELTLPHPRAKERDFVMKPLERIGVSF